MSSGDALLELVDATIELLGSIILDQRFPVRRSKWLRKILDVGLGLPTAMLLAALPAQAQLNENCVVSVLNRNVQVKANGTWVLPNIPANFGPLRARATCVQNGVTSYGESAPFTITANGVVTLPVIVLGQSTPIPTALHISTPLTALDRIGAATQLRVLATYPNGSQPVDVTGNGTTYRVSNPAVATVDPSGLLTAVGSALVIVQASNEGAQGILSVRVALASTDSDGDGIPDSDEVRLGMNPNSPADAQIDLDHDGLTALEEFRLGTGPNNPDTDGDGISDGDEAKCRLGPCTNPLLADTDGDGVRDLTEIRTGSDPLNAASFNLGAALASLRVTPPNFTLVVNPLTGNASVQLSVIGTLIDGFEVNLTSTARQTAYASSNLASCNFGAPDGRVFGSQTGACNITVSNNGRSVVVSGAVQAFSPGAVSFVAIPGYANGVAVNGDYAFVASGSTGLQVVSLSADRRTPSVVASLHLGASSNDITLAGNIAYLATSAGLKVVDISAPMTPRLLGTFADVGNALGVKVHGPTAYVTAGSSLFIINVANPNAMIQLGAIGVGGIAWNVDIDSTRNLAAVAAGEHGLKLVDVSNLFAPILRGTADYGDIRGVALRGNTAFVAHYSLGVASIDIRNPALPALLSFTKLSLSALLNGVALSDNFVLGAGVMLANGVLFVDATNPNALTPRTILRFPERLDNGMGIAHDNAFVYLAADSTGLERGGSIGDSRLYIGQYQSRVDLAGVRPTTNITAPANGALVYEGSQLTVSVEAADDLAVQSVRFMVAGTTVFTTTTAPYRYTFTVPTGISSLELGATARDLGGNEGTAMAVTLAVAPDPLTRVTGLVTDTNGAPLAGATVLVNGGRTASTGANGRFDLIGVPSVLGSIIAQASYTPQAGPTLTGSSAPKPAILAGTTDVGTVLASDVRFETNYGADAITCQDCIVQRRMPFPFAFYGRIWTSLIVGSGHLTFDNFDIDFDESLPAFSRFPRISAFFDDLSIGTRYVNASLPDRFIVTWDGVGHQSFLGSNTFQIQLFRDGRIVFAFKGITALTSGSITGLNPWPDAPLMSVDFSLAHEFDVPAATAVYEYFTSTSPFDLDNALVVFTPSPHGGYSVRTISTPAVAQVSALTGAVGGSGAAMLRAPDAARASAQFRQRSVRQLSTADIANAEVYITSSSSPRYLGMTNTDAQGRFSLEGVPAGGINVLVRRNGVVVARGSGMFGGGRVDQAQWLHIELVSADIEPRTDPARR